MEMPAHIGVADYLRLGAKFVVANVGMSEDLRYARQLHGGHISMKKLQLGLETKRRKREQNCQSYDHFRAQLDMYDPNLDVGREQINNRSVDEAEWDLYLKPVTAFDINCRRHFEVFRGMRMMLIGHKSDPNRLKRIEAHPPGERMRILWTD
jgi:hypothetical protein